MCQQLWPHWMHFHFLWSLERSLPAHQRWNSSVPPAAVQSCKVSAQWPRTSPHTAVGPHLSGAPHHLIKMSLWTEADRTWDLLAKYVSRSVSCCLPQERCSASGFDECTSWFGWPGKLRAQVASGLFCSQWQNSRWFQQSLNFTANASFPDLRCYPRFCQQVAISTFRLNFRKVLWANINSLFRKLLRLCVGCSDWKLGKISFQISPNI